MTTLAVLVFGAWPAPAHGADKFRVAQILIAGNTETPAYLLELLLPFRPGEVVSGADLRLAQRRLRCVGLWVGPAVSALSDPAYDADWKDVLVRVEEGRWNRLVFVGYELALFRLTGDLERVNYAGLRIREQVCH